MQDNKQPQLSSINAAAMIVTALLADGVAIVLDFIYLGFMVSLVFNFMVFPMWFWLSGVKFTMNDLYFAFGFWLVSFIPVVSFLPEITAVVTRKILVVKFAGKGKEFVGKLLNSKTVKLGIKVAEVAAPELAPEIAATQKGLRVAARLNSARTERTGPAYGERVPKTGSTSSFDKARDKSPQTSSPQTKPRVGQEIRTQPIPALQ